MKTGRLIIWLAPVFFLLASSELSAQSAVDSRLQKLEDTVRALERRVASLEDQLHAQNATTPVAAGKANWRKLHQGMSEAEVEQLLGSPSRVDEYGLFTMWQYGEHPGQGSVKFDGKHKLEGWSEP